MKAYFFQKHFSKLLANHLAKQLVMYIEHNHWIQFILVIHVNNNKVISRILSFARDQKLRKALGQAYGQEFDLEIGWPLLIQVLLNHLTKYWLDAKNFFIESKDPCQDPQSDHKDLEFHSQSKNVTWEILVYGYFRSLEGLFWWFI